MKIRYVGSSLKVVIAATGQEVERDEVVDVKQDVARELTRQETWEAAEAAEEEKE